MEMGVNKTHRCSCWGRDEGSFILHGRMMGNKKVQIVFMKWHIVPIGYPSEKTRFEGYKKKENYNISFPQHHVCWPYLFFQGMDMKNEVEPTYRYLKIIFTPFPELFKRVTRGYGLLVFDANWNVQFVLSWAMPRVTFWTKARVFLWLSSHLRTCWT